MSRTLLVSIKPEYARLIFAGSKTIELRRTRPNINAGDTLAIYVSSPEQELRGVAEIVDLLEGSPAELWRLVSSRCGVSRSVFDDYFADASRGYGIVLRRPTQIRPRSLTALRRSISGFTPPQVYRYLTSRDADRLGLASVIPPRLAA